MLLSVRLSVVFPFVCPSVAYIANTSVIREPKSLPCPNLEGRFPTFDATHRPLSRSKGQMLRSSGPLTLTYITYFPNGKAYELQTWFTDGRWRSASATGAVTSTVKGQGHKVTRSVWAVLAQCYTCIIRGRRGHTMSAEPGVHAFKEGRIKMSQSWSERDLKTDLKTLFAVCRKF